MKLGVKDLIGVFQVVAWLTSASVVQAQWPSSSTSNVLLCNSPGAQSVSRLVSDGAGGAIVLWQDARVSTNVDIYAIRVLSTGILDAAWPANGAVLCAASGSQTNVVGISDGSGGVVACWQDLRSGASADVYAMRLQGNGSPASGWAVNGVPICAATGNQNSAVLVSDGAHGAFITWADARSDSGDIYVQHALGSGSVDPAWPADGLALSVQPGIQSSPDIASDGAGGCFVVWSDNRGGFASDVYMQHVRANGTLDPLWPAGGLVACAAAGQQLRPQIALDGVGGALVVWQDGRSPAGIDVYASRVSASGSLATSWPSGGLLLCGAGGDQVVPRLASDGSGGAFVAWRDGRSAGQTDIYATHVLASAGIDSAIPVDGVALCTAAGNQQNTRIVGDGTRGVLVAWDDQRSGATQTNVYATHLRADGSLDPVWTLNGVALTTANGAQNDPSIVADGSGGVIASWTDSRAGAATDIYAQRVGPDGVLGGTVVGVVGVRVPALRMGAPVPNPSRGLRAQLQFDLEHEGSIRLRVLDVFGRIVEDGVEQPFAAGRHQLVFEPRHRLSPGVYCLLAVRNGLTVAERSWVVYR